MHEMSIVQSLLGLCEKNAKEQNAKKITKIEIKIGKLSGIEPHLLESSFDVFKEGTICNDANLVIRVQNIVVECEDCHFNGELTKFEFICPSCGKSNLKVIDGEDMMLMHLEMF